MGEPATNRCFAFVYQTEISEVEDIAFTSVAALDPNLALAEDANDTPVPTDPKPIADNLRKSRLEVISSAD